MALTEYKIARLLKKAAKYPDQLTREEKATLLYIRVLQEQRNIKND